MTSIFQTENQTSSDVWANSPQATSDSIFTDEAGSVWAEPQTSTNDIFNDENEDVWDQDSDGSTIEQILEEAIEQLEELDTSTALIVTNVLISLKDLL